MVADDGTHLYDGIRHPDHVPGDPPNIWTLHARVPAAANAAWLGKPAVIVWQFELSAS